MPKRVVRRFVLIRRHRTERSSRTECHGVLRADSWVLTGHCRGPPVPSASGTHGLPRGYSGDPKCDATAQNAAPARRIFFGSHTTHPSSMHASRTLVLTPALRPSVAPSRPLCPGLLAYFARPTCTCAGRWREPRPDRRGACRVVGVLVQYVWRSHGTRVPCHVRSLAALVRSSAYSSSVVAVRCRSKLGQHSLPGRCVCPRYPSPLRRVTSSCVLDAYSRALNGIRLARSFARGTRAAVQVIGTQLKALRCGWTTVDFVGQVRATNAAPLRAQPRATTAPWLVLRSSRGSLMLCSLSPHRALTRP